MSHRLAFALICAALLATPAYADGPASEAEVARVTEVLQGMGCTIGASGVEKDDDGDFEIDDAACADGKFEIELNADFTLDSMERD